MIYLIHFEKPLHHARHYLGYCEDGRLSDRLCRHSSGHGSRLMRAVQQSGIRWSVVRVWCGGRDEERALKRQKNTPRLCPVCRLEHTRSKFMESQWEQLKRYMKAVERLLSRNGPTRSKASIDEADKIIEVGDAWAAITYAGNIQIGATVHDPGVRYHKDGSGTPPSSDPVPINDPEHGIHNGYVHEAKSAYWSVRALASWHLCQQGCGR